MNAIKNSIKQFKANKYHSNLLGESLEDLCRKSTAKTLENPDENINSQVVQAINEETAQSPREIANLLKKRLQQDNPQKQFLAVVLVGKVLRECSAVMSLHQEELLQEVARVIARPTKRDTGPAQRAKQAAKDLLRSYGRTGVDAIRIAARENFQAVRTGNAFVPGGYGSTQPVQTPGYPSNYPPGTYPTSAYPSAGYAAAPPTGPMAYPPYQYQQGPASGGGAAAGERASLLDEVRRMIEHAKAHTELLQEMLVNSDGVRDESERELQVELLVEVRELRDMFTPYLEQLSTLEGQDVEALVCEALEAVDVLDNAMALEKEVSSVAQETAFKAMQPSPLRPPPGQVPGKDLIDFSDLDAALPAAPTPADTADPFAGLSSTAPSASHPQDPWAALTAPSPAPTSTQAAGQGFYGQQQQQNQYAAAQQPPGGAQQGSALQWQQQQQPGGYPPQGPPAQMMQMGMGPGYQQQQQFGSPPAAMGMSGLGQAGMQMQRGGNQPSAQPYTSPLPVFSMGPDAPSQAPYGSGPPLQYTGGMQQPYAQPNPNNPFGNPTSPRGYAASPSQGFAQPPASNPFTSAQPTPAAGQKSSVDHEWEMFFADRAAGAQPAQGGPAGRVQDA